MAKQYSRGWNPLLVQMHRDSITNQHIDVVLGRIILHGTGTKILR